MRDRTGESYRLLSKKLAQFNIYPQVEMKPSIDGDTYKPQKTNDGGKEWKESLSVQRLHPKFFPSPTIKFVEWVSHAPRLRTP